MAHLVPNEDGYELKKLYVAESNRREGIGTKLLNFVKTKGKITLTCLGSNTAAKEFYDKNMELGEVEHRFSKRDNVEYSLLHYSSR